MNRMRNSRQRRDYYAARRQTIMTPSSINERRDGGDRDYGPHCDVERGVRIYW